MVFKPVYFIIHLYTSWPIYNLVISAACTYKEYRVHGTTWRVALWKSLSETKLRTYIHKAGRGRRLGWDFYSFFFDLWLNPRFLGLHISRKSSSRVAICRMDALRRDRVLCCRSFNFFYFTLRYRYFYDLILPLPQLNTSSRRGVHPRRSVGLKQWL